MREAHTDHTRPSRVNATSSTGKLVGLTGYATVGKDELADILVRKYGYVKYGWADRIYDVAQAINPWIWCGWRPRKLRSILRNKTWAEAKRIPGVRKYLQWIGTEIGRHCMYEGVWIDSLMPKILKDIRSGRNVVVTNCRHSNEADAIEEAGGCIVLVDRPGIGPVNSHSSESGECFDRAVFRVINDSGLENLEEWADALDAAVGRTHPDYSMNLVPFLNAVRRGISDGVKLILNTAAPSSEEAEAWRRRHRIECMSIDGGVEVYVDGVPAGDVRYSDNILEISVTIAR